jgi:nicotinamide mononucleotide adenylyltransferase
MARDYLHGTGQFEVLGGYMSPVSDKYGKADLAPAHHRVRMCELALENGANDWVTVDAWEAMLDHHSPTARVMERFSAALNVDGGVPTINAEGVEERRPIRVMLLAGTDLIKSMQVPGLWEPDDIRRIVGDFGCVVVERAGTDLMDIILEHDILYEHRAHIFMVRQVVLSNAKYFINTIYI